MGIPVFYRWLLERFPKSVVPVVADPPRLADGVQLPPDAAAPNPNGVEFDNLYLDMNGIIHPCFHPDHRPAPTSYDEVFNAVFTYVDHIFSLVRPRKLLLMAIDGVAPRAKMNQQRSRRFRSAKDAADVAAEQEKLTCESEKMREPVKTTKMDSNVITPGTEFMDSLSKALRFYIQFRLNNDPGWKGIKVILSDANVPGEGEHKVASYIREQRNLPGFDPNTRHCLYGLDADLIMLALATHEIHFSVLREDVRGAKKSRGEMDDIAKIKFQFLHIWILREYLERDLRMPGVLLKADFERLIDDFVFICLFVGNDFLPHIPSLEISEGAIDLLIKVYKKEFSRMGGYLTSSFEVNLERVEHFLWEVGSHECATFRRRLQIWNRRKYQIGANRSVVVEDKQDDGSSWMEGPKESVDLVGAYTSDTGSSCIPKREKLSVVQEGWKERYYAEKFEVASGDVCTKKHAVLKYVEGICWFMHYYYQGVCSWQWFYPYHYAPFASDFIDLKDLEIHFTLGVPFKPFDQLMAVLPAASAHALPLAYRKLMTDPSSSIIDFYPRDFDLDLNGKRFSWQAVCKLPFVKESRLLQEIRNVEQTLTDEEKKRNSCAIDALFVNISHPMSSKIISFYERKKDHPKLSGVKLKKRLNPMLSDGMNGYIYLSRETLCSSEVYSPVEGMGMIKNNHTIFVYYKGPASHVHICQIPPGATLPEKILSNKDILPPLGLWQKKSAPFRHINSESKTKRVFENSIVLAKRKRWDHQGGKKWKQEMDHSGVLGKRNHEDHEQGMKHGQDTSHSGVHGKWKHRDHRWGEKGKQETNHSGAPGKRKRGDFMQGRKGRQERNHANGFPGARGKMEQKNGGRRVRKMRSNFKK